MNTQEVIKKSIQEGPEIKRKWYTEEGKFQYEDFAKAKGKIIGHFKTEAGRYGGRQQMESYYRVYECGIMIRLNVSQFKISVVHTIGLPYTVLKSTKQEFEKKHQLIIKHLI